VHFYSNFWSFKRSNRGTMTQFRASRRRAPPPRLPGLARAFPRHRTFPRSCTHRGGSKPVLPLAGRSRHQMTVGPPTVLLCVRVPPKVWSSYRCNDAGNLHDGGLELQLPLLAINGTVASRVQAPNSPQSAMAATATGFLYCALLHGRPATPRLL
jgi:hypothetical protein